MKIKPVVKGLLTFIPGMQSILPSTGTGGTNSAYWCYGIWLKHLTLLWENGTHTIPNTIAELGPGDSIGTGLAAMLCGANNYYAMDVVKHSNIETNLVIFDELIELIKSRAKRPTKGWPDIDKYYDDTLFPSHILTDELLEETLSEKRISAIRNAIKNPEYQNEGVTIKYMVPWSADNTIEEETVDVILSHSVLQEIAELEGAYRALYLWLKPNGMMTHQIDFGAQYFADTWNGHRAYPEFLWTIIKGRRPYLINRQPPSVHVDFLKKNKFKITCLLKSYREDGIPRSKLSAYWRNITDDDFTCDGAVIQAKKQVPGAE